MVKGKIQIGFMDAAIGGVQGNRIAVAGFANGRVCDATAQGAAVITVDREGFGILLRDQWGDLTGKDNLLGP